MMLLLRKNKDIRVFFFKKAYIFLSSRTLGLEQGQRAGRGSGQQLPQAELEQPVHAGQPGVHKERHHLLQV